MNSAFLSHGPCKSLFDSHTHLPHTYTPATHEPFIFQRIEEKLRASKRSSKLRESIRKAKEFERNQQVQDVCMNTLERIFSSALLLLRRSIANCNKPK
jgi:hypothetical protein